MAHGSKRMTYSHCMGKATVAGTGNATGRHRIQCSLVPIPIEDQSEYFYVWYFPFNPCTGPVPFACSVNTMTVWKASRIMHYKVKSDYKIHILYLGRVHNAMLRPSKFPLYRIRKWTLIYVTGASFMTMRTRATYLQLETSLNIRASPRV